MNLKSKIVYLEVFIALQRSRDHFVVHLMTQICKYETV